MRPVKTGLAALSFLLFLFNVNAGAAVIDFDPLSNPNGTAYSGHSQDGFTVTSTQGDWFEGHFWGNPVPSIFGGPLYGSDDAEILVTGGDFRFISVDVVSNTAPGTRVDILGLMDGVVQYGYSYTIAVAGLFETLVHPFQFDVLIDELYIGMVAGDNTTSYNIDNIVLRGETAVPAPAALGLVLLGLAGVGAVRRRRMAR